MQMNEIVGQIAGRDYAVVRPTIIHVKDKRRAYNKVIVDGINHPNGEPIKFKSTDTAERHIRNMGLAKD